MLALKEETQLQMQKPCTSTFLSAPSWPLFSVPMLLFLVDQELYCLASCISMFLNPFTPGNIL